MKKDFSDYINSDEKVQFAVVKFKSCNGMESRSFTKAECEFDVLKGDDTKSLWVTLDQMFKNGIRFINNIINGVDTTDSEKDALKRIETYYQSKGKKNNFIL